MKLLAPRPSPLLALAAFLAASRLAAGPPAPAPLADAVEKSDQAAARRLLSQHADVNAPQVDGMTALHWAVQLDHADMVRQLLKAGARATATNHYGVTPLSLACVNGNGTVVDLLLAAGGDPNATLRGGETALMTAARTGRLAPVKALLARGAQVNAKERRGQTALMWAAAEGHAAVVEFLIQAGAEIGATLPDSGFNAFFFAVREGRADAMRALLKAGVDVNAPMQPHKPNGKGPRKGMSGLVLAVENGHFDLAVALLDAGADPNDQRSGFTALHVLTWVRKPNRGDGDDGDPAPIGSGALTSLQFVRTMKVHGADVNTRLQTGKSGKGILTRKGATPFLLAAVTADAAYMRLLVELGADPLLGNAEHATPLMAAAGVGTLAPTEEAGTEPEALEAVQLCLELGAEVNAVDDNGETAMHGAAYKSLPKVAEYLAAHGAKVDVWSRPNRYGWTPLSIAEGYRVGNFKPSVETLAALQAAMRAAGVTPPASSAPVATADTDAYAPAGAKKATR
jgi:ankyrin repeat protein